MSLATWDKYFMSICDTVALNVKCKSRQIGAIAVINRQIAATGYNGPPKNFPHCGDICPRRAQNYPSGEGLHLCPAVHAEANVVASAARLGICLVGATLYLNTCIPCKNCMGLLINAGICEVVVKERVGYDRLGLMMAEEGGIVIREVEKS